MVCLEVFVVCIAGFEIIIWHQVIEKDGTEYYIIM